MDTIPAVGLCQTGQHISNRNVSLTVLEAGSPRSGCQLVRFQCSWCSRSWASAQVQVLFHMHWSKKESKGQVKMRIFAQRCQKCSNPPFEIPEFTEENISRILNNLVFRILKKCYKEGFQSMKEIRTVKDNYVEGPHDIHNCEACLQGFCAQSGLGLTTQPPVSLTLPVISLPTTVRTPIHKPSPTKSSTTAGAVTGGTSMKDREVSPNPWFSKPTQAASLRANTNYHVETRIQVPRSSENFYSHTAQNPTRSLPTTVRTPMHKPSPTKSSTTAGAVTGGASVKKREVSPNPWFPKPTQAASLRANTNYHVETRIQVPPSSENFYSHTAGNPKRRNVGICCCLIILILIIVMVVVIVVKTNV
ncbi:receptor-transporting protein 3 isoform X2 [Rhinolophus sinicus]|uniref:receptor-transporting protein 3 isoform X2 n=1 Tax=Rhinolophus sinicus TaxID=89399 RepID=UPI003D7B65D4